MSLLNGIKHLYPEARFNQFKLRDDGNGPYLEFWDESLGPQPTVAQLEIAAQEYKDVPNSVTKRQFKVACFDRGFLDDLNFALGRATARRQLNFNEDINVLRVDPVVELLRERIGYTNDQMDDLFIIASRL